MLPEEWEKLRKLKEFIEKGSAVAAFEGPIVIVNPVFIETGNYIGIVQEQIDNTLSALDNDLKSDIEALVASKTNEFNNITYSPPIT